MLSPAMAFGWFAMLLVLGVFAMVVSHWASRLRIPWALTLATMALGGVALLLAGHALILGLVLIGALR